MKLEGAVKNSRSPQGVLNTTYTEELKEPVLTHSPSTCEAHRSDLLKDHF
jgi:hypothetical protein